MELDDDDWGLSAEEFDSLERDALLKIASQQQQQQPSASCSFNQQQSQQLHLSNKPIFNSPSKKVDPLPDGLPKSSPVSKPKPVESSKALPKLSVKFILHATGNIAAKFLYDPVLVGALRKVPKANWNAKERLWIFPVSSLLSAEKVLSAISGFNVEVEKLDMLVQRAIAAASVAPDLRDWYDRIPDHIESKLMPFQRDGVRFVLQHGGRALLADEMGLGKTLQAIAVAACIRSSWPVLILAPSSLRLHWASMIHQWLDIPSSDILVVLSQSSGSNRAGFNIVSSSRSTIRLDGLFNIISYDAVPKLQNKLMTSEFKVVIADESHFLKNAQAKRTTGSLPVIKKAQYAILLSGTPALSRPIELFKQLEALYPDVYKNVHEYGNRYCKGGIFGVYQGASNHEELHNLMKATVMIRRLKKDVLSELPVKRRQQVFLDLPEKDMKQINALFRELEVVKRKIKACASDEEVESLKFTEKNLINKIYTDSAEAKISGVLDYLGTVIEAGCKFLIFAHHQSMIDSIHEFLLKKKVGCIRIDGKTAAASRQALVTDFQEKDAIKAAVLSIRAGGVGLTLTAASTVIFAELSWTPGDLIQAEDRAHRIGQVSSVNVYYLLANDTVDDIIWDVVQSKLENLGQMLDGQEKTLEVSASQQRSSPAKQRTLDTYMKRCSNLDASEHQPKLKVPRH
ncbi:PREDICTED: SWI/SNF-related matrix-associated actin-dependent regulator of chromatin subfamily A-like protein 1 isoform X1 [Populus euphratica]|uniref:SWI/SNF-related matrix-associated actin-dependent regulator of chromatin subfamily A-like protein 1 isoform X1 n=1 Tax=Populus euphratica TaxID=75702 RepID=A0AAJ6X0M2_POPEU|nr:PREDICTED: SWI/SNF-related matrix-associated actin-dependent regulator of chromatin subfamily A-like protein 1 isoform X1 [Populus euphratica]